MKTKAILLSSVAANVVLAVVLLKTANSSKPQENAAAESAVAFPAKAATPQTTAPADATPAVPAAANPQQFDWRLVESEDYRKYIANLRAIGCPEETIRDIIVADVNKLYESKRKQLVGPAKKFEFWKPGAMMGAAVDTERTEKERALNKEKRELLIALLGTAPDEKPDLLAGAASQLEAMFDFLPAEKRNRVFEMMQDMQGRMQKAMKGGVPDPEDLRKAMKESEDALAAILTPDELLDYNLRFSMTANLMRVQLAGFEPSESEFLEIFKKRKAYDDQYGMSSQFLKGEEKEKQKAAEKELDDQIKSLLGDSRHQEYKRAQDFAYQAMYRAAERENLGKDVAVKAYDMKQLAESEAKRIRADKALTPEQRTTALQGIRTETENSLRAVFGEKAFQSYEKQNGTYWLNMISPNPKR